MTLAWAKQQMANGARVRRAAWAGKYLYFDHDRGEIMRVIEDGQDGADLIGFPVGAAEPWEWVLDPDRFAEDWETVEGAPVWAAGVERGLL